DLWQQWAATGSLLKHTLHRSRLWQRSRARSSIMDNSGIDKMEESWRHVDPGGVQEGGAAQQGSSVLNTGREAYLRTKQMLDEASAVSNTLFLDEGDMSRRYQRAYEREDALDAAAAAAAAAGGSGAGGMPGTSSGGSGFFNGGSLFFPPAGGDGGGSSAGGAGEGILAAVAAGRSVPPGAVEIRPEEKQFCGAFLELQALVNRLPPGARVRPEQISSILQNMYGFAEEAEAASSDTADRLRELRGSGAPAVAVAAAAAHELSLEKDTWALLLMMNGVDKKDEEILEVRRREEEGGDANDSTGTPPGPNASDEAVLVSMRARDSEFRRTEAVVEWLQGATHTRLNALGLGGGGGGEGCCLGWSDTL
ncbi:unnamed protein product, partial [Ectocarpus fasciculatus]